MTRRAWVLCKQASMPRPLAPFNGIKLAVLVIKSFFSKPLLCSPPHILMILSTFQSIFFLLLSFFLFF